ncbi:MAG: N-acetylmuramoyl-L-alanine amidase [Firmicutes bacterium]|nr:N-acetylmuramoyl-L-alanine amidase [Bacillota bacterium]
MFISIKKKTIILVSAFVICVTSFLLVISFAAASATIAPPNGFVVVVDAGHGGHDGGATGVATGAREADINLAIARLLRDFLQQNGFEVVMTRSTRDGLYGMARTGRKMRDMEERRRIINEASPDLVVSIHQNSFPSPRERGPQVFHAPSSERGRATAQTMQQTMNAALDSNRTARSGDYFILQATDYLSILIESGFLTNPEEDRLLSTPQHQEKVAFTIFKGIISILMG